MHVGLFGKLPSHGDFLRRRTSDAFVAAWDEWLQACMSASRATLGDRWLDVYLTSPAWRFTAAADACGPTPLVGLMVPSVDRVGRYFPLTIVAELPPSVAPVTAVTASTEFFERAEHLVIETLEAESVDFENFDEQVTGLANALVAFGVSPQVLIDEETAALLSGHGDRQWHVPIGSSEQLSSVFEQMFSHVLAAEFDPVTVWWTEGSSIVEPSCLISAGLPDPGTFAALLEGSWPQHRWRSIRARIDRPSPATALPAGDQTLRFRSIASSDVGRVRVVNQDSFIEHPESGVWAVADGVGGLSDGEAASRMACDALADFVQTGTFDETIAAAAARIAAVNDQLLRASARSLLGDRSGSTIVVLLVRGSRCAILWAGDSRAYRWRSGRLDQLTRDHSATGSGPLALAESHAITRAVGAHPRLELDICREQVRAGDRFLLCSDGLTRAVPDEQIRACLGAPDIELAVQGLIRTTLNAGAPDNVTAVLVEACPDTVGTGL